MPQTTLCTNTLCSYKASSAPRPRGSSLRSDQRGRTPAGMHHVPRQAQRALSVVDMGHVQQRLLQALAAQQGLALRQAVGQQHAVRVRVVRAALQAGDEIHRRAVLALVQPLEEGVLPVGAGHAPDDGRGRHAHGLAIARHPLAQRFHLQLLQVGHQVQQPRAVGRDVQQLWPSTLQLTRPASASCAGALTPAAPAGNAGPWPRRRPACRSAPPRPPSARWTGPPPTIPNSGRPPSRTSRTPARPARPARAPPPRWP